MLINFAFSLHISWNAHISSAPILSIRGREDGRHPSTIRICFWYCKSCTFPLQVSMKLRASCLSVSSSIHPFSPVFGKYGGQLGPKMCFITGSLVQGVSGFLFGFLTYIKDVSTFISLSYVFRFLEGMGTAMAWSAALGILMKIFPNKVGTYLSSFCIMLHIPSDVYSNRLPG